jgi:hypothetical protein
MLFIDGKSGSAGNAVTSSAPEVEETSVWNEPELPTANWQSAPDALQPLHGSLPSHLAFRLRQLLHATRARLRPGPGSIASPASAADGC